MTRTCQDIRDEIDNIEYELDRLTEQRLALEAEHLLLRAELRAARRIDAATAPLMTATDEQFARIIRTALATEYEDQR